MIKLEPALLQAVSKPARYTGNELNAVKKERQLMKCSWALALPDVYEVGMSNLGLKILYQVLNDREDTVAERVYAPWIDMEEKMRSEDLELWSLESFSPIKTFDFVGFSLQYEMIYTNILNMLDLAKIPLQSAARGEEDPFVVGGGPCVYNPEPVAEFFDLFIIGEGEEVIEELTELFITWKMAQCPGGRTEFLRRATQLEGIYVPSLNLAVQINNPLCQLGNTNNIFVGFRWQPHHEIQLHRLPALAKSRSCRRKQILFCNAFINHIA